MKRRCSYYFIALCLFSFTIFAMAQTVSNSKTKTIPGEASNPQSQSNHPIKGPDGKDQQFIKTAAITDAAEIELGQLAQEKAANPKVKAFGQRMVKDHSKNDDLIKASHRSSTLAFPPPSMRNIRQRNLVCRRKLERNLIVTISG